jgi:hypothetical protein
VAVIKPFLGDEVEESTVISLAIRSLPALFYHINHYQQVFTLIGLLSFGAPISNT